MSDIKFDDQYNYNNYSAPVGVQPKGLVAFVMKLSGGVIKTQKQAELVLIGVFVFCILLTGFLLGNRGTGNLTLIENDPVYDESTP